MLRTLGGWRSITAWWYHYQLPQRNVSKHLACSTRSPPLFSLHKNTTSAKSIFLKVLCCRTELNMFPLCQHPAGAGKRECVQHMTHVSRAGGVIVCLWIPNVSPQHRVHLCSSPNNTHHRRPVVVCDPVCVYASIGYISDIFYNHWLNISVSAQGYNFPKALDTWPASGSG